MASHQNVGQNNTWKADDNQSKGFSKTGTKFIEILEGSSKSRESCIDKRVKDDLVSYDVAHI